MQLPLARWIGMQPATPTRLREEAVPSVTLPRLLWSFFWVGLTAYGGKPTSYLFNELGRRRRWVTADDYAEAYTMAKLLPGGTGIGTAVFMVERLRGSAVALFCLVPFVAPGAVIALALTLFAMGRARPPWVEGALAGVALGAIAMLFSNGVQIIPTARKARLGLLLGAAAFGAAVLEINLLLVLLLLVPLGLALNRPRSKACAGKDS
jgi:chromate transporter